MPNSRKAPTKDRIKELRGLVRDDPAAAALYSRIAAEHLQAELLTGLDDDWAAARKTSKDRIAARKRAWYHANRERVRAKQREYYLANREKIRAKHRAYYQENWDHVRDQQQEYREINRDDINARRKARRQARRGEGSGSLTASRERGT